MAKQGPAGDRTRRLLAWYDRHGRDLPWRRRPGQGWPDPYHVWLSEIMLQQTTVAAVKGYFAAFLARWPRLGDLAGAPLDDVLKAWAGLGYYARARNLRACAKALVESHRGKFPEDEAQLRLLPGIGPYTAAAIAAIAHGRRAAAVDGNVERVMARLHAIETPLPQAKSTIRDLTLALVPAERPGDFAQALMDLGATICTPKSPNCAYCPLTDDCLARRKGIAALLPRKAERGTPPTRRGTAFWIERADGAILLRRRPEKGLLGGMMEVPSTPWTETPGPSPGRQAPVAARWRRVAGGVSHTFTHFTLELAILRARVPRNVALKGDGDFRWVAPKDLAGEALPTLMRKIVATAREDLD
ncbi:MAG: A/G-specific adenine glycosylase [Alphaproteobacteria bacterium]|nr:A/G-specific adenine glycosylase [Alphaproteobacteria bacterium]